MSSSLLLLLLLLLRIWCRMVAAAAAAFGTRELARTPQCNPLTTTHNPTTANPSCNIFATLRSHAGLTLRTRPPTPDYRPDCRPLIAVPSRHLGPSCSPRPSCKTAVASHERRCSVTESSNIDGEGTWEGYSCGDGETGHALALRDPHFDEPAHGQRAAGQADRKLRTDAARSNRNLFLHKNKHAGRAEWVQRRGAP